MRRAAVATAAITGLAMLAACVAGGPRYEAEDLLGLVGAGDAPSGLVGEESGWIHELAEDADFFAEVWEHAAGEPDECFPVFTAPYLFVGSVAPDEADDPAIEIAAYLEPDDRPGSVAVNARVFDDAEAAAAFLPAVEAAAAGCPDGYRLTGGAGDERWAASSVRAGAVTGLPAGVSGLVLDETPAPGSPPQRTILLRHGNVVVAVLAQPFADASFGVEEADRLARLTADRLVGRITPGPAGGNSSSGSSTTAGPPRR